METWEMFWKEAVWEMLPFKDVVKRMQRWLVPTHCSDLTLKKTLDMLCAGSANEGVSLCGMKYSFGNFHAHFPCLTASGSTSPFPTVMLNSTIPFLNSNYDFLINQFVDLLDFLWTQAARGTMSVRQVILFVRYSRQNKRGKNKGNLMWPVWLFLR